MSDEELQRLLLGFRQRRYFRSIMFTCPEAASAADAVGLIGATIEKSPMRHPTEPWEAGIGRCRALFDSERFYVRSTEPQVRKAFQAPRRKSKYRYGIDVLQYKSEKGVIIFVAAPFSGLVSEIIASIKERYTGTNLKYIRPALDRLYSFLIRDGSASGITTVGINWYVSGEENFANQLTIRGTNVATSNLFSELVRSERRIGDKGVRFWVRRIQLIAPPLPGGSSGLKVTFDRSGQAAVWVSEGALNLREFFPLVNQLAAAGIMEEGTAVPSDPIEEEGLMG